MTKKKKSPEELLAEKLLYKKETSWKKYKDELKDEVFSFSDGYKSFMSKCKTERLCASYIVDELKENGYLDIETIETIKSGDKFYKNIKGKVVIAAIAGKDLSKFQIVGSHMDSPRLDLKPMPLYEDGELALFQSHYYGGIKKYQWVNQPLAIHGIIFTKKGKAVEIHLGDDPDEPKFIIPDLLPHLAKEQIKKDGRTVIEGEDLNIIVGHIPLDGDIKDSIKINILNYLKEKYDIVEEDFAFGELEFVPAMEPCDIGFDKALIAAYGQDDKVCVYTSFKALLDVNDPAHTAVGLFVDKEEIGSTGDTGAESRVLLNFARDYCKKIDLSIDPGEVLEYSRALSADVTSAMDPTFKGVSDPQNTSYLGKGISIEKYGGGGGKYDTNDARAEYMQYLRVLAEKNEIPWQTGENGKIDIGGGGTIAMFLSRYGMDCVDAGPCMLAMHSPAEVASKADIYSAFSFYKVFFAD